MISKKCHQDKMNHLVENDVKLLTTYTKLTFDRLVHLVEDPRDFDLVLESISKLDIPKSEIYDLSFSTFCKFVIFKYTEKFSYPVEEKLYVSNMLAKYFPRLQIKINFGYLSSGDISEKLSQYYFVLMALFHKRLKDNFFTPQIWSKVENGFKRGSCPDIVGHMQNWITVLHAVERDDWFLTSRTEGLKICQPKTLVITRSV